MLSQATAPLLALLQQPPFPGHAPFYFPGHRHGQGVDRELIELLGKNLFAADLPELPGVSDQIEAAQSLAAAAYGADYTYFLTHGSTIGVQTMLLATVGAQEKVLVGRNCHRATIGGLVLSGAMPIYVPTTWDHRFRLDVGVSADTLAHALRQHPDAKAVMLVSPNYFGVTGAMEQWVSLCHDRGIPLLIDSAHGAHLGFHPDLPIGAVTAGADLVVQSTHKTASALSQAAMLHGQGGRVDREKVAAALGILQTTSPNLVLLTSLDVARRQMALYGKPLMDRVIGFAQRLRRAAIAPFLIPDPAHIPSLDPTRITIVVPQGTGFALDQSLCHHPQFPIVAEMPTAEHLVLALSYGNSEDDIDRLIAALQTTPLAPASHPFPHPPAHLPPLAYSPRAAYFAPGVTVSLEQSIGKVSRSLLCPYPPGIPLICPGEIISAAAVDYLQQIHQAGGVIQGWTEERKISVMAESDLG